MSITIDCGEGKHDVCSGRGRHHYLIPQLNDGTTFLCACTCHAIRNATSVQTNPPHTDEATLNTDITERT